MIVSIAWRNLWRNPARSLLTMLALSGSLVIMLLYAALVEGISRQMVTQATDYSSAHLQIHRQTFIDDRDLYATVPWSYLAKMEQAFPTLQVAPRLYAAALASAGQHSSSVMIQAVDPKREPEVTQLLSGLSEPISQLGQVRGATEPFPRYNLLVGSQMAKRMALKPGDELILVTQAADGTVGNGLFRIAGLLRTVDPNMERRGILMSIEGYQSLMALQQGFHELAIRVAEIDDLQPTQPLIEQRLQQWQAQQPLDPFGGNLLLRNWQQLNPAVAELLALSRSMMLLMGLIIIGLASLGMVNTLLMAIHERTHEFGILLSIGMSRWWLLQMVLLESLFLALVSALAGTLLSTLLCNHLESHGIDLSGQLPDGYEWGGILFDPVMQVYLEPQAIIQLVGLMLLITLLAALLPSWRSTRLRPAEVLRC
ncbi:MAG: ABC transporter permease [Gammaproteobacteria bacterium]|nr:ABC transporter permease [Gammaproteobacteria bacterium]MBT7307292.1 ABC transporter permease [Gammaproteobacteria bacterium]